MPLLRTMISNSYSLSVKYYRNKFDNCNHLSIILNSLACRRGREKRKSWISNGTNFTKWSWTKSQFHEWIILINQQQAYESFHHERLMEGFFFFITKSRSNITTISAKPVCTSVSECVRLHWWEEVKKLVWMNISSLSPPVPACPSCLMPLSSFLLR